MNSSTDPAILTKAVLRAAEHLGLSQALPDILGITAEAGLANGTRNLDPMRPEWGAALKFTALFRALITVLGNAQNAQEWLRTSHQVLDGVPSELLRTEDGRARVLRYLDAVQKYEIKLPPRGRH